MNLQEMQNMNTEFQIIMILLHFNPINLMLKYSIIKFESFTTIIITTKKEIADMMYEKFSFKSDLIHSHLSNNTNEENIRKYNEFEEKLKTEGLNGLDEYILKH